MERYYSQTISTEIVTENGIRIGRVLDAVVDPDTGRVHGFLLAPRGKKVVVAHDVLFWGNRLIIRDEDCVFDTDEIIKIDRVLEKRIPILKNKVVTKSGQYLGKVFDYAIDEKMFILTKIFVAKTFLGFVAYDEKVIAHKNILEIKKEKIIVKNPLDPAKVKEKKAYAEKRKLKIDPAPTPS